LAQIEIGWQWRTWQLMGKCTLKNLRETWTRQNAGRMMRINYNFFSSKRKKQSFIMSLDTNEKERKKEA
jgi:hypothetical protein